jgi:hypothetical protein
VQLAADPLHLLSYPDHLGVEVDVLPPHAEDFAAPHAVQEHEHERR